MDKSRLSLLTAFVAVFVASITSCTSTAKAPVENVNYSEVQNYFFNNDAPLPANPKIESQAEFDKYFSPAAFMGKDGRPTDIDFDHTFVIALVKPATDHATNLVPEVLTLDSDSLKLTYRHEVGEAQSFTIKPICLLQVDRRYASFPLVLNEKEVKIK